MILPLLDCAGFSLSLSSVSSADEASPSEESRASSVPDAAWGCRSAFPEDTGPSVFLPSCAVAGAEFEVGGVWKRAGAVGCRPKWVWEGFDWGPLVL